MFLLKRDKFYFLKAIVFVGILLIGLLVYAGWQFTTPVQHSANLVIVSLPNGATVKQVGADLLDKGLIRSRWWFETWVWLTGREKKFVAGEYKLPADSSVISLANLLTGGVKPYNEVVLRFIEGWTAKQMGEYLAANSFGTAAGFNKLVAEPEILLKEAGLSGSQLFDGPLKSSSLEGYLFPDTYRVYRDADQTKIIGKMLVNFQNKFSTGWLAELKRRGLTVNQVVTMASIIEKEVPTDGDRAIVADIFWRRLSIGQALQADSTVNYVTGGNAAAVTAADLQVKSPYNTYLHKGLPPGPISNPGSSALQAALFPKANPYWYFLTTPDGQVIYSKTFVEHRAAKQRYLK